MGLVPSPAAGRRGRRGHRQPFTEINIVPLTDVVLVLLIIFMVTAQFIERAPTGMDLNLPVASEVQDLDDLGGLRVRVDRDGGLAVDGVESSPETLADDLRAAARDPQQLVIVEGDKETVLQNVVTIMDAALAVGLPNVVLATAAEPPADPAAPALATEPAAAPEPAPEPEPERATGDLPFVTPPGR